MEMTKSYTLAAFMLLLFSVVACGRPEEPVAKIQIRAAPDSLSYPGFTHLELQWEMLRELAGATAPPIVFVHLLSDVGEVLRTFDHALPFDWAPGEEMLDYSLLFQSALAPSLPTGNYRLTMGLYDVGGRRWPLQLDGEEAGHHEYVVAKLLVEESSKPEPMFYFSPSWMESEPGTDVQVLGVRWLTEEGTIRISDVEGRGEILLQFRIPRPSDGAVELVLDEGAQLPVVSVSSACSVGSEAVEGAGLHRVVLEISPELLDVEDSTDCEVVIRPNYHLLDTAALSRRALLLEVLAWFPLE